MNGTLIITPTPTNWVRAVSNRAIIYARYSSDAQRDASIDDQLRICRVRAEREGWNVVAEFTDAAISGSTLRRPGYQNLLEYLGAGEVDIVLAESLDRFSRDQEHVAAFYKRTRFHRVRVVTLAEGDITELHVGFKGTLGAVFLKDLAAKTHRGEEGCILAGRAFGNPPYGYRVVRRIGWDGEFERGLREIDPVQAGIIRRVFTDYAAGRSPLAIARALNAEGVPGPAGGPWYHASIRGRAARGDGILRNPIYVGRLMWNRSSSLVDPDTGSRRRRSNAEREVVTVALPHLRIIDDVLWQAVQDRLVAESVPRSGQTAKPTGFWNHRRPRHLLTGKVVCGACGGLVGRVGGAYLGCLAAREGACRNRRTMARHTLESRVLGILERDLMQPKLVAAFVSSFNQEAARLQREASAGLDTTRRELATADARLSRLADAIADGLSSPALQRKLDELEAHRAGLQSRIASAAAAPQVLAPNLGTLYRDHIAALRTALNDTLDPSALEAARALIDRVVLHPPDDPDDPPRIEFDGDLAEMLRAGGADIPKDPPSSPSRPEALSTLSLKAVAGGGAPLPCLSRANSLSSPRRA